MQEVKKVALSVEAAAIFLGVKKNYLYQLIHKRKIPCYHPSGGRVFFRESELTEYLFRNRQAADYEEGA